MESSYKILHLGSLQCISTSYCNFLKETVHVSSFSTVHLTFFGDKGGCYWFCILRGNESGWCLVRDGLGWVVVCCLTLVQISSSCEAETTKYLQCFITHHTREQDEVNSVEWIGIIWGIHRCDVHLEPHVSLEHCRPRTASLILHPEAHGWRDTMAQFCHLQEPHDGQHHKRSNIMQFTVKATLSFAMSGIRRDHRAHCYHS